MSGPPKGCPAATQSFIATLPINTGGPLEKIAPKPKPPETKPTRKPIRRAAGTISGLDVVVSNAGYANVAPIEIGDDAEGGHRDPA